MGYIESRHLVAMTPQIIKLFQSSDIQRDKLIIVALQIRQIGQPGYIKGSQLITGAKQTRQIGQPGYIKGSQLITHAIQSRQIGQPGYIKGSQLIIVAHQIHQTGQLGYIKGSQLITTAIQNLQIGEVLNAGKAGNVFILQIQVSYPIHYYFHSVILIQGYGAVGVRRPADIWVEIFHGIGKRRIEGLGEIGDIQCAQVGNSTPRLS